MSLFFPRFALIVLLTLITPICHAAPAEKTLQDQVGAMTDKTKELARELQQETAKTADELKESASEKIDSLPETPVEASAETTPHSLSEDMEKARDIIMNNAGSNSFARGLVIALLQPIFLASMFSLGLLSGQMSERLKHVWVLPVILYAATVIGAFISTYHAEWKPQFDGGHLKFLEALQSTDMVGVVIGLVVGAIVGFSFGVPPFFAVIGAIGIGLILGFSQTGNMGKHHESLLPFWAGFGLTGLLINIFGIGFETFFQSINFRIVTRLIGLATAALSLFLGAKLL